MARGSAARAVLFASAAALLSARPVLGGRQNLTLYRVTPRNYTTADNMNLGDAAGDAYFAFIKLGVPAQCRNSTFGPCTPSTNIPGFNIFMQFFIEADERLGPYSQCNPDLKTGEYTCDHWFGSGGCWYNDTDHPEWRSEFADVCSREECHCPVLLHKVMGKESINTTTPFPQNPPHWAEQCQTSMQAVGHVVFNESLSPLLTSFKSTEGECCAACDSPAWQPPQVPFSRMCVLTTYYANSSTCEPHGYRPQPHSTTPVPTPRPEAYTAYRTPGRSNASKVASQMFTYMGRTMMPGAWYSTPSAGRCREGQVMGRDCWWRLVGTGRQINSSCVDDRIQENIVKRNKGCFDACPNPLDKTSDCWLICFFNVVVGNGGFPGITRAEALEPFERAFLPEADGGCPSVPACPEPCLPPCWAVPKGERCTDEPGALPAGAEAAEDVRGWLYASAQQLSGGALLTDLAEVLI